MAAHPNAVDLATIRNLGAIHGYYDVERQEAQAVIDGYVAATQLPPEPVPQPPTAEDRVALQLRIDSLEAYRKDTLEPRLARAQDRVNGMIERALSPGSIAPLAGLGTLAFVGAADRLTSLVARAQVSATQTNVHPPITDVLSLLAKSIQVVFPEGNAVTDTTQRILAATGIGLLMAGVVLVVLFLSGRLDPSDWRTLFPSQSDAKARRTGLSSQWPLAAIALTSLPGIAMLLAVNGATDSLVSFTLGHALAAAFVAATCLALESADAHYPGASATTVPGARIAVVPAILCALVVVGLVVIGMTIDPRTHLVDGLLAIGLLAATIPLSVALRRSGLLRAQRGIQQAIHGIGIEIEALRRRIGGAESHATLDVARRESEVLQRKHENEVAKKHASSAYEDGYLLGRQHRANRGVPPDYALPRPSPERSDETNGANRPLHEEGLDGDRT